VYCCLEGQPGALKLPHTQGLGRGPTIWCIVCSLLLFPGLEPVTFQSHNNNFTSCAKVTPHSVLLFEHICQIIHLTLFSIALRSSTLISSLPLCNNSSTDLHSIAFLPTCNKETNKTLHIPLITIYEALTQTPNTTLTL